MKMADYIIMFLLILVCLFTPVFYRSMLASQVSIESNKYSEYITTACYDAMQSADMTSGYCFASQPQRDKVTETFYKSLSECFNYKSTSQQQLLQYYVPCIALIDYDGFYICYTQDTIAPDGSIDYIQYTTPINYWTENYGAFRLVYRLDNRLEVTDKTTNTTYSGTNQEVYQQILAHKGYVPTELQFLSNDQEYTDTKSNAIVTATVLQIEYYINMHNDFYNHYDARYKFELPRVSDEDWARLLQNPTIISFLQGMQTEYGNSYLNIYAMSGAEMTKAIMYDIAQGSDGTLYYHEAGCPYNTNTLRTASMQKCASLGAEPCHHCIFSN